MKNYKKTIMILLTVAVLLIAVFAAGRYGWKLLGFRACESAGVESVEVSENTVKIKGFYPGSFPEGFCGYYAEEQDGSLYVGFRFSAVFGFFETGDFDVDIPVKGSIHKVVLKTKTDESIIWTAESDNSAVPDAPTDAPSVLTLPILDEIDQTVTIGTAGSSQLAVQAAARLLDWGVNTGLDTEEISDAASTWLTAKRDALTEFLPKLELVDDAYQRLLTSDARELLDSAGCAEMAITWGNAPVEAVEAVMRAAGLR